jgi:5'-deoxynucleotidase YfbR-like HD superfamily hydrolase
VHFHLNPDLLSSLVEVGELKRIRSASRVGSIAERLFLAAWTELAASRDIQSTMESNVAAAVSAVRLGDLDFLTLLDLGVDHLEAIAILHNAASSLPRLPSFAYQVGSCRPGSPLQFPQLLARQPRAGITHPNRPRIIFEPPENHAEHCLMVAVYAVALAPVFGADPATVWLAGLAHHLHNAALPDSGFAGEMLLGSHLEPIVQRATERALAELPLPVRDSVERARRILPNADTPEGRAFHAADTLDRVWQIEQHLRAGQVDLKFVLEEMAIVHSGPVKSFQDDVLRAAGLMA